MDNTAGSARALPADLPLRASEDWLLGALLTGGRSSPGFLRLLGEVGPELPTGPQGGPCKPTSGVLTSTAVRAQEAQEAMAGPRDAVAIAVAVAGAVIHGFCGRKEKQSCTRKLLYPNRGPGNPASG